MKKERFEQRLFRVFAQAGYSPIRILTVTPEEHKVVTEYFGFQFKLESMERQQLFFRGHTDCMAYLKRIGTL